ncbi:MAG TPA: DCC1-like thiol-disulfide oxidoreductase family protein [Chitinophagales bacterium]|nr:DCC1-like thiol-disulfide oxidoreductase family protein [Chitinophagales bacterium]
MKTSHQFAIVYDDQCPLCVAYTNLFVKWKWIQPADRISFSEFEKKSWTENIDLNRARNEIPIVELQSGNIFYGVEGLTKILSQRFPVIERITHLLFIRWFITRLYKLISFNRRIVIPAKSCRSKFDCAPDFNLKYRLVFMVLSAIIATVITFLFGVSTHQVLSDSIPQSGFYFLLIAGSGWVLQFLFSFLLREKQFDYLSHLSAVMLIGVLVLLPSITINFLTGRIITATTIITLCISGGIMLWQLVWRVRLLGISKGWIVAWLINLYGGAIFWISFLQLFKR